MDNTQPILIARTSDLVCALGVSQPTAAKVLVAAGARKVGRMWFVASSALRPQLGPDILAKVEGIIRARGGAL